MKTQIELLKVPEHFTAIVLADGKPLQGLLIMLSLEITRKNRFNIILGPSNREGKVEVSRKDLEREVARTQKMFPMDYDDLSSFKEEIHVSAMSLDHVESSLAAYELYHDCGEYPSGYREKLANACTTLKGLQAKRLDVKVTPMPRRGSSRIITRSVMVQSNGNRLTKRSG
jgi:hypothetical protein